MILIAGLGNPGRKYEKTKHNVGFEVIDRLVDRFSIPSSGISMKGMYGRGTIAGEKAILLKPMTYMNASGESIAAFVRYYRLDPAKELIVVYDDVDLAPGQLRIRKRGSAGSHRGMKSIVECLGTGDFARVRVGIGPKPEKWDLADYVLAPFSAAARKEVNAACDRAADAVEWIIGGRIDAAMENFNHYETGEDE